MANILIVEDEPMLFELVQAVLSKSGHEIEVVTTGRQALDLLDSKVFDLIILDWVLPDVCGLEVCAQFRANGGNTPVLMATTRCDVEQKVEGFEAGVDDYLTKPFHPRELCARVRSLLNRPRNFLGDILRVGNIMLDTRRNIVSISGTEVPLLPKEFALLQFLMRNPNKVFSRDKLVDSVWPSESDVSPVNLRTYIKRIRKKLSVVEEQVPLRNVHGVGYMLAV